MRDDQEESRKPLGVLACLSLGFETIAHFPQLALLPGLLDLFLWLGPRLSLAPLVRPLMSGWPAPDPNLAPVYQTLRVLLEELATDFNGFVLLNPGPLLGVPELMGQRMTLARPMGPRPDLPINSWAMLLGWTVFLIICGLGLNALYLQPIGRRVIEMTESPLPGPTTWPRIWGQLVQFMAGLMIALAIMSIPALLILGLISTLNMVLGSFFTMLALALVMYTAVQFIFTVPGMLQLRQPLHKALQDSILLVRVDFAGTMGLLLAVLVISQGLNFVWALPEPDSWTMLVGIGGHALVSTALTAALLVFYQERLAYLRLIQEAYATQRAPSQVTDI